MQTRHVRPDLVGNRRRRAGEEPQAYARANRFQRHRVRLGDDFRNSLLFRLDDWFEPKKLREHELAVWKVRGEMFANHAYQARLCLFVERRWFFLSLTFFLCLTLLLTSLALLLTSFTLLLTSLALLLTSFTLLLTSLALLLTSFTLVLTSLFPLFFTADRVVHVINDGCAFFHVICFYSSKCKFIFSALCNFSQRNNVRPLHVGELRLVSTSKQAEARL